MFVTESVADRATSPSILAFLQPPMWRSLLETLLGLQHLVIPKCASSVASYLARKTKD
jgi:hypothetical protein